MNERVQIIWLDQRYLVLHFPSEEAGLKICKEYERHHRTKGKHVGFGYHSFTMYPYQKYEELCSGKTTVKRDSSCMVEEDGDEVVFETKRYKLVRVKNPEPSQSRCQILCFVC